MISRTRIGPIGLAVKIVDEVLLKTLLFRNLNAFRASSSVRVPSNFFLSISLALILTGQVLS